MAFPTDIDLDRPSPVEQLQIAFAVRIARDIVAADGILDMDEMRLMMMVFPTRLMQKCRFIDDDTTLSRAYYRAYVESTRVLPLVLDTQQKLALISLFHRACVIDGELHPAEMRVLEASAESLKIDADLLREHLLGLHREESTSRS